MKITQQKFKEEITWDIILIIFTLAFVAFLFLQGLPGPAIRPSTHILYIDSSLSKSDNIYIHNSTLISLLLQRESIEDQLYASAEEEKMQIRNIYMALMVVLLPIMFLGGKSNKNDHNNKQQKIIVVIVLILIPLMLYVNSHIDERSMRTKEKVLRTHFALDSLINSSQLATIWYKLDYKELDDQIENVPHPSYRKLKRAAHPDLEVIFFYWIPWIVVFIYNHNRIRKFFLHDRATKSEANS